MQDIFYHHPWDTVRTASFPEIHSSFSSPHAPRTSEVVCWNREVGQWQGAAGGATVGWDLDSPPHLLVFFFFWYPTIFLLSGSLPLLGSPLPPILKVEIKILSNITIAPPSGRAVNCYVCARNRLVAQDQGWTGPVSVQLIYLKQWRCSFQERTPLFKRMVQQWYIGQRLCLH